MIAIICMRELPNPRTVFFHNKIVFLFALGFGFSMIFSTDNIKQNKNLKQSVGSGF